MFPFPPFLLKETVMKTKRFLPVKILGCVAGGALLLFGLLASLNVFSHV